ncbi:hypothetical protein AVEN_187208-1, partial [Araneus ventricosus]
FVREETLARHQELCIHNKPQRVSLPKDLTIKFKNLNRCVRHRFAIFSDFECMLKNVSTAAPGPSSSHSYCIEKDEPISYAMLVTNQDDEIIFHQYYAGPHPVENFLMKAK